MFYNIYADDTVLVSSGVTDLQAVSKNQCMLQRIKEWCDLNKIVLYQKKTKHMYVGPKHKIRGDLIEFETVEDSIKRVREFKYLGVLLDDNLTFDKNIEKGINVVNSKIVSLSRLRKYMDQCTSVLLYKQMIAGLYVYNHGICHIKGYKEATAPSKSSSENYFGY